MSNLQKYVKAFVETFDVEEEQLNDMKYQDFSWDSIGHMALIASLEDVFDIMMDTDDIIDFSSFGKGKEILGKYNVGF
jgi:acyl carrier protein